MARQISLQEMGFTPNDIVLMRKIPFSLKKFRKDYPYRGYPNGHVVLQQWIERQHREMGFEKAGISLKEFINVWRNLPDDMPATERHRFMRHYAYARHHSDIETHVLRRLSHELREYPQSEFRHTLRGSYVPLRRLDWTHEQAMRMLQLIEHPEGIRRVCRVTRKGVNYELIATWINYEFDISWLDFGLRIPELHPDESHFLVEFLLKFYRRDISDTSNSRTYSECRERIKKVLYVYRDDRRQEHMSHNDAIMEALNSLLATT